MKLRTWLKIRIVAPLVLAPFVVITLVAESLLMAVVILVFTVVMAICDFKFWRCRFCEERLPRGEGLRRELDLAYCPYCGEKLDI